MLETLIWIIFLSGILALGFYQLSAKNSLIISLVLLVFLSAFAPTWVVVIFWFAWVAFLLTILNPALRMRYLTKPLLAWFKRVQPPISKEEREVIEAGGVWWDSEFFSGDPNWEKLLHVKNSTLTQEEQTFIDGPVEKFCSLLDDWKISVDNDLPKKGWDYIKQEKFWGLSIPKSQGGLGFSALAHSTVITKIASRSMTAAISIMVPNSLGPAIFIECFGSEDQKKYYLPLLAKGEEISCFALTSPEAGSDAASIIDSGVITRDKFNGKEILGIRLNFNKRYITLAPIATLIGLAIKVYDPDNLYSEKKELGITCVMIPSNLQGVKIGNRHKPMILSFMNGPIVGKDVFIPFDMVVGGESGIGEGWAMLMECLALGRGISLPSLATAAHQFCFKTTSAYSVVRRQFKRSIGDFEGISTLLARIGGFSYIADATRLFTVTAVDMGCKPSVASAIAKYHLTELARKSVNHAIDIHGGKGIQAGPRNYLLQLFNAIPISVTVEGANILTRNLIIFGQGVIRSHPFLQKEISIAQGESSNNQLKEFDNLLLKHVGFTLSRFVRTLVYGLTGGRFIGSCRSKPLKYYLQQMTRMSSAFALITDITLLVLGAKLKFKESLSARFGDIVSYLYMASAVVRHYEETGEPKDEAPFMEWALSYCLAKIQSSFDGILQNYPQKYLGKFLWRMLFPFGVSYHYPNDKFSFELAKRMQTHSSLRDTLTKWCYVDKSTKDPVALVESVFQKTGEIKSFLELVPNYEGQADPILLQQIEKMHKDGKISVEDFDILNQFLQARMNAIQVDEFKKGRDVNEPANNFAKAQKTDE